MKNLKKHFDIPNILDSLKKDFIDGKISIKGVSEELYLANLIPFVCDDLAIKMINYDKL